MASAGCRRAAEPSEIGALASLALGCSWVGLVGGPPDTPLAALGGCCWGESRLLWLSDPIRGSWGDGSAAGERWSVPAEGEHCQGDEGFG
jgi:hypothetical protein